VVEECPEKIGINCANEDEKRNIVGPKKNKIPIN
jgi:hypothetical protein